MRRFLGAGAATAAVLTLAGCTDKPSAAPPDSPPDAVTGEPTPDQEPAVQPVAGPVRVDLEAGEIADDPRIRALERYVVARQQSLRSGAVTESLTAVATLPWLNQQQDTIEDARKRGWTVPAEPVVTVPSLQAEGPDALLQTCLWEPSVAFVDRTSGEPVEPTEQGWTSVDVRMVQVEGRWLVDGAALASHACTGG